MESKILDQLDELIYKARMDAWISACEWIINLGNDESPDCKKAFEEYAKKFKKLQEADC